ncbi:MAG TPA: oligopeptide:H+ symporter [Burkholderiaceae bacterium]
MTASTTLDAATSGAPNGNAKAKFPRQIPFIIGSEGCERFSFYGMRTILTVFLMTSLLAAIPKELREHEAKEVFHTFVIGVYFFPLLGGWLADRFFGKYNTVLWFSLIYCIGHACLAIFEHSRNGFYFGLFLIALGAGGIKPLVASFMGDQFDQTNKSLAKAAFGAFYWAINFGSFFSTLATPWVLTNYGAAWAFGIPGVLMAVATLLFWAARKHYVRVPVETNNPNAFMKVIRTALFSHEQGESRTGLIVAALGPIAAAFGAWVLRDSGFVTAVSVAIVSVMAFGGMGAWMQLERAKRVHGEESVDAVRAVLRLLLVFFLTTPFWTLYDQYSSTWVLQGEKMIAPAWFQASQMQTLNAVLLLLMIPFNNLLLYPLLEKMGIEVTAMRRMAAGMFIVTLSWLPIIAFQASLENGAQVSLLWQAVPYLLLSFAEVLLSTTGLEFAYSQAPASMKGILMSFFYLSFSIGNVWTLLVTSSMQHKGVVAYVGSTGMSAAMFEMWFYIGFGIVAALIFALYARSYKELDNYRAA